MTTLTQFSPNSFGPGGRAISPSEQAHAIWRRELDAARRAERRSRRSFRLPRMRLRPVG